MTLLQPALELRSVGCFTFNETCSLVISLKLIGIFTTYSLLTLLDPSLFRSSAITRVILREPISLDGSDSRGAEAPSSGNKSEASTLASSSGAQGIVRRPDLT